MLFGVCLGFHKGGFMKAWFKVLRLRTGRFRVHVVQESFWLGFLRGSRREGLKAQGFERDSP